MVVASAEGDAPGPSGSDAAAAEPAGSAPAETGGQSSAKKVSSPKAYKPKKKAPYPGDDNYVAAELSQPTPAVTNGIWSQGFIDYERHKNLAPGQEENPTRKSLTTGAVLGVDWTFRSGSVDVPKAFQIGVFGGYNDTDNDFTNTSFIDPVTRLPVNRFDSEQSIDGGFVGAYLGYVNDKLSADLSFKADLFDLTQSSRFNGFALTNDGCGGRTIDPLTGTQRGTADLVDYVIASNLYYRIDVSQRSWFEPTIGARLTITDFSNDRNVIVDSFKGTQVGTLGLEDGHALRLQAGVRFGERGTTPEGWLWTYTVGAFLYSDVVVDGFTFTSTSGGLVSSVDEGKLRALGQIMTRLDVGQGSSYSLTLETRGGEDVWGVGGQIGYRYEW